MSDNTNAYIKVIEAAKIADESIVWYWDKIIDLDELKTEAMRENDILKIQKADKDQKSLIEKITWEEREVKKLDKKLRDLE